MQPHSSYWLDTSALPRFPKLNRDLDVDVAVIGAGITGMTAAYLLAKAGRSVALVERGPLGGVDTGWTTAHLTSVTDQRLSALVRKFGAPAARAVWDAGGAAIDQIVRLIDAEKIKCDFHWVPGYLHEPPSGDSADPEEMRREAVAARELGLDAAFIAAVPVWDRPGVRYPRQALFHPRKYLRGLAEALPGRACHVFEHTSADEFTARPHAVKCGEHRIRCERVVIATHTPLQGTTATFPALLFQTKLSLYTSYALAARLPRGDLPEALFWNTADRYDYLRIHHSGSDAVLIFGGEDHKTGQVGNTEAAFQRLERRFRHRFPHARIDHRWSGQVVETNDGLPFIGETDDKQFVATGFSGNGMTFGTLGALMAVDWVLGRRNPWRELFDAHRKKVLGGTWEYVKENADYPYLMLRDRLAPASSESAKSLSQGEGKIINHQGRKVAAYRDEHGKIVLLSPVCPHLQCIVAWNPAERTWDCPCHGSRFKAAGAVISGPAEEPLEKIEEE